MADHADTQHTAAPYSRRVDQYFSQCHQRSRQVPLCTQNLSMAQNSPGPTDVYGQQFMPYITSAPSEHAPYNTQPQHIQRDYQPEHMAYGVPGWDGLTFAQPTKGPHELCNATQIVGVPQNVQVMVEQHPIPINVGQSADMYAAPFFPTHEEAEATSVPTHPSVQNLQLRDTRLRIQRGISVPSTSQQQLHGEGIHSHDWYSQPATSPTVQPSPHCLDLQDRRIDPNLRLSAPPIYLSAESSSRPRHLKRKHPRRSIRAPPVAFPAQLRNERIQIQSTPDSYQGLVYVHKGESGNHEEVECTYWLPEDYPIYVPEKIRPKEPRITQATIMRLTPTIIYGEFQASSCKGCRTRGICVHFTFLLGARSTPDGLICDRCKADAKEEPIKAHRVCPVHNRPILSPFLSSLPEDILVTAGQQARAKEFLRRAQACDWDDVLPTEEPQMGEGLAQTLDDAKNLRGSSGSNSSGLDGESDEADENARPAKRLKTDQEEEDDSEIAIGIHATQSPMLAKKNVDRRYDYCGFVAQPDGRKQHQSSSHCLEQSHLFGMQPPAISSPGQIRCREQDNI